MTSPPSRRRWEPWLVAAVTLGVYAPCLLGGFLHWDDDRYIVQNAFVHAPTWEGLARLFTQPFYANYHPLHVASYALDHALFGRSAWGYHLLNLLYFAGGAALIAAFLRRAFPEQRWVLLAALLFAVHPVHVESVAWLSARKDVLAVLFGAIYLWSHLRASQAGSRRARLGWSIGSLLAFTVALLCKAIVAPLPVALLAYDFLVARRRAREALVAFAAPIVLAGGMLVVAYFAQAGAGAVKTYPGGNVWTGVLTALPVTARYLGLLVAPIGLSALYQVETRVDAFDPAVQGTVALLVLLGAGAVWAWRRRQPIPAFCLLWFAITLGPVSGIVPLSHLMADRYLLLPSLGFAILVAWGLSRLEAIWPRWGRAFLAAGMLYVAALGGASLARSFDWRDGLTLWADTVTKAPGDPIAHLNVGSALADAGRMREAAQHFHRALTLRPAMAAARRNLIRAARSLQQRGDAAGAAWARGLLEAAPSRAPPSAPR